MSFQLCSLIACDFSIHVVALVWLRSKLYSVWNYFFKTVSFHEVRLLVFRKWPQTISLTEMVKGTFCFVIDGVHWCVLWWTLAQCEIRPRKFLFLFFDQVLCIRDNLRFFHCRAVVRLVIEWLSSFQICVPVYSRSRLQFLLDIDILSLCFLVTTQLHVRAPETTLLHTDILCCLLSIPPIRIAQFLSLLFQPRHIDTRS